MSPANVFILAFHDNFASKLIERSDKLAGLTLLVALEKGLEEKGLKSST